MNKCHLVCCLAVVTTAHAEPVVNTQGSALPFTEVAKQQGISVRHGGFGSGAAIDPRNASRFYALTDRGPVADGDQKNKKIFVTPSLSPSIGHFEIGKDGAVTLLKTFPLKRPDGRPLTGLPNPKGMGATGEKAIDLNGKSLPEDAYGFDGEGLVALKDGSFWASDEYGPHIVHFNPDGMEQERISPRGLQTKGRKLPAVLAKRTPNRGMEGLTITPDGKTLVGIMQSALNNPDKDAATNRSLTRIVTFDLASGKTSQYLYRQNGSNLSNSEILALDSKRFLVNERDQKIPQANSKAQKHVYLIDLSAATDVSDPADHENGLQVNGRALEQNSWEELSAAGIVPARKVLVLDLVASNNYPHDKPEAMWLLGKDRLAVLNDDDFAIDSEEGKLKQKVLPSTRKTDANTLYIYPIKLD